MATVRDTMAAAVADSTRRAYGVAIDSWTDHARRVGISAWPEAPDAAAAWLAAVLDWLQELASRGLAVSTISQRLSGLKFAAAQEHRIAHVVLTAAPELRTFMSGLVRLNRGARPKRARAFTLREWRAVHAALRRQRTPRAVRNRAILACGVAAALRAQSLADLSLSDISRATSVDGRTLDLRWSKTDQAGVGRRVTLRRAQDRLVDPVSALDEWLTVLAQFGYAAVTTPEAPLFPHVRGASVQGQLRISNAAETITELVRAAAAAAGLEAVDEYSSHSLRATYTTLSFAAGVAESRVAAVTGHRNLNVLREYDRTSGEQLAQADYLGG